MAEESAKLRIPYIAAAQAQKHVTHNEAMTLLDTLLQLSVIDKDLTAPPGSPAEGDTYIVAGAGGTATGAWVGWEKRVARFIDGEWLSYLPGAGGGEGWLAWVMDEDAMYRFDATNWDLAGIPGPQGADAGILMLWDTNTADSDPGAGDLKANNAALGSATKLFISKTSRGGCNIATFLLSLDDSSTSSRRGILVLTRPSDEAQATFDVTAVTDATNYVKVDVSGHGGATSFVATDPISLQFWPTGDSGGAGGFTDLEGEWSAATTYDDLDVVSRLGSSYTSIGGGNLNNPPESSPGDWQFLAEKGAPGDDGLDGDNGVDGSDPGILLNWDTNTADSDPGAGDLKANNASLASATQLFVSKTSRGGSSIAAFLLALDDSTNASRKGGLILTRTADEAQASFNVGAVTDATGYVKVAVSGHAGATSFTAADPISFQFARDGDKGTDGAGSGDVVGPAGATDSRPALFDGTSGKLLKQAAAVLGDAAFKNTGTGAGTVAAGDDSRITGALQQGKRSLWIPARAMIPRVTNGAAFGLIEMATNRNMFATLDFDTTTQEFAQFDILMPKSWDLGTVSFKPVWSHPATTTNFGVVWGLAGVATSDDDAGDVAFGTAQTSTDTGGTTNDIYIEPESAAITIAGTPAQGDRVQFQINRTVANGSDTMAVDARLHGIHLNYALNAATDG